MDNINLDNFIEAFLRLLFEKNLLTSDEFFDALTKVRNKAL